MLEREVVYGEPISVVKQDKPSYDELFQKHLKNLTTYEQRVKFGMGDDVQAKHRQYTRSNLDGLRLD